MNSGKKKKTKQTGNKEKTSGNEKTRRKQVETRKLNGKLKS